MHAFPYRAALAASCLTVCASTAGAQSYLQNGDFEGGYQQLSNGQLANHWEAAGRPDLGSSIFSVPTSTEGSIGAFQRMTAGAIGREAGICQRVTGLTPGKVVVFKGLVYQKAAGSTAWAAIDPNNALPAGSLPTRTYQIPYTSGVWTPFEITATVGAGGSVCVYLWTYFQSGSISYINADALSLSDVPNNIPDVTPVRAFVDAVEVQWTSVAGAARYEIRYSTQPITDANWPSATLVGLQFTPVPAASGTLQSTWFRGLSPGTTYHVAMKFQRAGGAWSDLSNVASIATQPPGAPPYWAWKQKERLTEWYNWVLQDCQAADLNRGATADDPTNPLKWYFGGWDHDCERQVGIGSVLTIVRNEYILDFWRRLSDHVWDLNFTNTSLDKNYYNSTWPRQRRPAWNESHHGGEASWNGVGLVFHDWDNPKWLERLVQYAALVHNWTGYTGNPPHLHFKTIWVKEAEWDFSSERGPQSHIDNPEDRRFTRALNYAAFRDPNSRMPDGQTIADFLGELDGSSAEDALKTDLGKPVGLLPGEIRFDNHTIGGYSGAWWRAAASMGGTVGTSSEWWYDWRVGFVQCRDAYFTLVDHWQNRGDPNALAAVREMIRYFSVQQALSSIPPAGMGDPPTLWPDKNEAWGHYQYLINCVYRQATKDPQFDGAFVGHAQNLWNLMPAPGGQRYVNITRSTLQWDTGSPCSPGTCTPRQPFFLAWQATKNKEWLARALDELYWVDVGSWLESLYNGSMTLGLLRRPTPPLTWNNNEFTNFAGLVLDDDTRHIKWITYNFDANNRPMQVWLWALKPGSYRLTYGPDLDLNDQMDSVEGSTGFTYAGPRTALDIVLPAGRMQVFEIQPDCSQGADTDGDGVADACDDCPGTAANAVVDARGCPPNYRGDFDHDGDVDLSDFSHLQRCLTGTGYEVTAPACGNASLDGDLDVDNTDVSAFLACLAGSDAPPPSSCIQ